MIGCWPSRSTVSQYFKRVNLEMDSEVPIMHTWMCLLCQFTDTLARCDGARLEIYLVAMIVQTWMLQTRGFGYMQLEAMLMQTGRQ
jgi:hypothetical protein